MSIQFDAQFSGFIKNHEGRISYSTHKRKITVFALNKDAAKDEILRQAKLHGFVNATIDHMNEVGK